MILLVPLESLELSGLCTVDDFWKYVGLSIDRHIFWIMARIKLIAPGDLHMPNLLTGLICKIAKTSSGMPSFR